MQRRQLLQSLVLAPLALLIPSLVTAQAPAAKGGGLQPLSEQDPLGKALKYVEDANKADPMRKDKKAFCNNCAKFNKCMSGDTACKPVADAKTAQRAPCDIFMGKSVNRNGWCMSWTKA